MRLATKMFYEEWKKGNCPPVLCSQHDAFYFNAEEKDTEEVVSVVKRVMKESGEKLIGIEIFSEIKVFTNFNSYDPGDLSEDQQKLWDAVMIKKVLE